MNNKKNNYRDLVNGIDDMITESVNNKMKKSIQQREVVIRKVYNRGNYNERRVDVAFAEDITQSVSIRNIPVNIPYNITEGDRAYLFYSGDRAENGYIGQLITYSSSNGVIQNYETVSFLNDLPTVNAMAEGKNIVLSVKRSSVLDRIAKEGNAQIWLYFERSVKRRRTNFVRRKLGTETQKRNLGSYIAKEWVHFEDKSPSAPKKLMTPKRMYYKGKDGLGFRARVVKDKLPTPTPSYMNHNGYVPTEFSLIRAKSNATRYKKELGVIDGRYTVKINYIEDILKQLVVDRNRNAMPTSGSFNNRIKILGLHGYQNKPKFHRINIRAKLVVNFRGTIYESDYSNEVVISCLADLYTSSFDWNSSYNLRHGMGIRN